jgi:hypothetical protein
MPKFEEEITQLKFMVDELQYWRYKLGLIRRQLDKLSEAKAEPEHCHPGVDIHRHEGGCVEVNIRF